MLANTHYKAIGNLVPYLGVYSTFVLNASRRFRYTLDLKMEQEKQENRRRIRAHAQATRHAALFPYAGQQIAPTPSPIPTGGFGIGPEQLASMMRDQDVKGLAVMLKTDAETGILRERFLWDACQDTSLIILMVAAVASVALGSAVPSMIPRLEIRSGSGTKVGDGGVIHEPLSEEDEGSAIHSMCLSNDTEQGWHNGGSIALAIIISIVVTAISDYRQSLEFQSLNKEKPNIHVEAQVIRGGRRLCIPIFDIVVGDVVHLHIGDKVPADGILINGHSLAIDESYMTGEARINQKDSQSPFLTAGCVVADGYGTMLVTGVGLFTERGVLMATILEDNGEETPLQVHLNGVATYISISGLVLALFVLVVLMIRFFSGNTRNPDGTLQFRPGTTGVAGSMDEAVKIFTIAVSIGIVAVPEGLPLAIILT
ncbi:hypothetical protein LguiA_008040 [Lonicera macranthoides]